MFWNSSIQRRVIIGDILLHAILTVAGFASHNELNAVLRMFTTFLPLLIAWFWVAPWFGLFDVDVVRSPKRVWWRTAWAWTAVAPLGALLRALWLGTVVIPIFALVLTGLNALGFVIWRVLYAWWARSRSM